MIKQDDLAKNDKIWCSLNTPDSNEENCDMVVFAIPFDGGVSFRSGASTAPKTLRENTQNSTPCTERLKFYEDFKIYDAGDFLIDTTREDMFQEVQNYVKELVKNDVKFTMIGGDHSVTIPVERGINDALNEEFGIIHIDAHMDLCDALEGDYLSHGNTERRALELENVKNFENLFFIGIRSIEPDEYALMKENNIQVKTSYDCFHEGIETVAYECINKMKKFNKVYLTIDIDALDPGFAAGTGTPQFGGLTPRMMLTLMEIIFTNLNVIGFDVVEIAPALDPSLTSMFAGRKLLTEGWGYFADEIGKLK